MDQLARLDKVIDRVNGLLKKHEQVKKECATLKEEREQLHRLLKERDAKVNELQDHLKVLKLAKQVSVSGAGDEEKVELKRKINEFIKEIDKCVALLNN